MTPTKPPDRRARLIVAACGGVAAAVAFILVYWIVTGSLEQWETVAAGLILMGILAGNGWLARSGRVTLAAWSLVGLLTLLISLDLTEYGIATPTASAYVIPIVLAAGCLGWRAALSVAGVGSAVVWGIAWAVVSGALPVEGAADISNLTFNAPALMVIFLLTALITGYAVRLND